jgi:hypothetical protein
MKRGIAIKIFITKIITSSQGFLTRSFRRKFFKEIFLMFIIVRPTIKKTRAVLQFHQKYLFYRIVS